MKGKRGKPGECIQELEICVIEVARVEGADSEHAARFAEPCDRRVHDLLEDRVVLARRWLLRGRELLFQHGSPGPDHLPERSLREDLSPDIPVRDAKNRVATEHSAFAIEDPTVGGVGAEKLDNLLHEPLDDRVEAKIARQHLGGLQQGRLLLDTPLVLTEQLGGVQGDAQLTSDRLGKPNLGGRPVARLGSMKPEDSDHAVEDQDGDGEHRARPEINKCLPGAQARVVELWCSHDVADSDRAALPRRQIRDGELVGYLSDWIDPGRIPLGVNRKHLF